jgi:hypothetical protein
MQLGTILRWLRRRRGERDAAEKRLHLTIAYSSAWLAMANRLFPADRDLSTYQCDVVTDRTDALIRVFGQRAANFTEIPASLMPGSSPEPTARAAEPPASPQPLPGLYL